jgi:hypothetical protein
MTKQGLFPDLKALIDGRLFEPQNESKPEVDFADYFGYSKTYWDKLSDKSKRAIHAVRPLPASHSYTVHFGHLEEWLNGQEETAYKMGGDFDLCPDFQRGHVWTREQQLRYVENLLRGIAPRELRFNSPIFDEHRRTGGDLHPYDFVCVDGLQRLTAVRLFLIGDFKVFDELYAEDLRGTPFDPFRMSMYFTMNVHSLNERSGLLRMYLDINNGGSAHTEAELDRVRALLKAT